MNSTETIDVADIAKAAEQLKDTDPGVIRTYLAGLVPDLIGICLQVVLAVLVYAIGTRVIKFARRVFNRWMVKRDADEGVTQFMDSLLKYFLYFILIIFVLNFFGVTTASVIAVVGSAGFTAGLALQGSLANFAGGILILIIKPFRVGDYIIEDTNKNEGTVAEISIFYTKLLTVDNQTVVVPNGMLANSSLTNVTHSGKRRVDLIVGISYEADLKKAKKIIMQSATEDPARLLDEEMNVFVSELGSSDVKIGCRFWVRTEDYWKAKWRMNEKLKLRLDENGIEIPYQKLDVKIRN